MNMKQWALFFIVTLSVNYVTATFIPFGGSRRKYYECNSRLRGFLSTKVKVISKTFVTKYGRECPLGNKEYTKYSVRNVKATGIQNFKLQDGCRYRIEDGQAIISFPILFENIGVSFFLDIPEGAGGFIGGLFRTVFRIIGSFVNKFLQIIFPSFPCNIEVTGNYESGFRLSGFEILEPSGRIIFSGGLSRHGGRLDSYQDLIFKPMYEVIYQFLRINFRQILVTGVEKWEYKKTVFTQFGINLDGGSGTRIGGSNGGYKTSDETEDDDTTDDTERTGGGEGYSGGKSGKTCTCVDDDGEED